MNARGDILGIGMALTDSFIAADDAFLNRNGLARGGTVFLGAQEMDRLMEKAQALGIRATCPGDNARNMCTAAACLGARASFVGAAGDDVLADSFERDMRRGGVDVRLTRLPGPSGSVLAVITPDGERSFACHMGRSDQLELLSASMPLGFRYLYATSTTLLVPSLTQVAVLRATDHARAGGVGVAVSLENAPYLSRHLHSELRSLLTHRFGLLIGNDEEMKTAFGAGSAGLDLALGAADIVVVKHGAAGSDVYAEGGKRWSSPAFPAPAVDTTGAGDFFAGAMLARLCQGHHPRDAAVAGAFLAAHVVERFGARLPNGFDSSTIPEGR